MNSSFAPTYFSRRTKRIASWLIFVFLLYVLSSGPVAWATNDAFHPAYFPEGVLLIYWPLLLLMKIMQMDQLFYWWTAMVWGGSPAGYTTL